MDEFTVRLAPKQSDKKLSVFKLHKDDSFTWTEAKMRRENEFQPWQIKIGSGRTARRFRAIKEGGFNDHASYFLLYKPKDKSDTYELCSVDESYTVSATQRYKTLTAEEAEEKFEQRHKMFNLFSVMHIKKNGEGSGEGLAERDSKSFKVSEMDDWDQSGDDEDSSPDDVDGEDSKKKARKKVSKKIKSEEDAPEEGLEESDEGDFEQREVDYMSDSSSDSSATENEKDETDVKGIAEEEALRNLLSTDDEEDADADQQKAMKDKVSSGLLSHQDIKREPDANGSDDSSDSEDYDVDEEKMESMFKGSLPAQLTLVEQEVKQEVDMVPVKPSTSTGKRKAPPETTSSIPQPPKRPCTSDAPASQSTSSPANGQEKIVENLVRKYLSRKPMTLRSLLKEIKSKLKRMEGVTPEMDSDLVNTIASIIKRINPDKQKVNEVIYLSLKS